MNAEESSGAGNTKGKLDKETVDRMGATGIVQIAPASRTPLMNLGTKQSMYVLVAAKSYGLT